MRVERARSEGIQIRDRFGIDRDGNTAASQAFAHAETLLDAKAFQVGARKIDIYVAAATQLILPA